MVVVVADGLGMHGRQVNDHCRVMAAGPSRCRGGCNADEKGTNAREGGCHHDCEH